MREPAEVLSLYYDRRRRQSEMHSAMLQIDSIYDGTATIPLPDAGKDVQPAVPNLLAQGVDQMASRIASVIPVVSFTPDRDSRAAERRSKTASRAVTAWWQADRMPLKMKRRARHLISYGLSPVSIGYDFDCQRPTWKLRDPRTTYPSTETYGETFTPENVLFAYRRNVAWLAHNGYGDAVYYITGKTLSQMTGDTQMLLLESVEPEGSCLYLTGYDEPFDTQSGRFTGTSLVEIVGGRNPAKCVLLKYVPSPSGKMLATVPYRIALNGPSGQFNTMVSQFFTWARLMALEILAVEKGIFPDTYLVGRPNEHPDFIDGPHDGRTGKVNIVTGGNIQTENFQPGYMTQPLIDRLERNQRLTAGIPSEFGGESGDNIRTARRGDAVLSGVIDFPIAEAQQVFEYALAEENKAAISLAKHFDGTAPVTIFVGIGNETQKVTYVADEVFTHDDHVVGYPITGTDVNTMLMATGQRVGLGTQSKRSAMEMDPVIANPELEHDRIIAEGLESALISGIQQQAASGALPPMIVAKVMDLVAKDRMEIAEAMTKVTEEAAAAAQQQTPPGMPPSADQMAAPGAAALTGSPIPGASPGQEDLSSLMSTLRKPTMTVMPGRGMEKGAI